MTEGPRNARPWVTALTRFVRHPSTNFVVGVALIVSGLADVLEDLRNGAGFELAVHHGVVVYGLFKVLTAIAHVLEGLEKSLLPYDASE